MKIPIYDFHADFLSTLLLDIGIKYTNLTINDVTLPDTIVPIGKYGDFVPKELFRKQFFDKYIDITEMQRELKVFE